MKKLILALAIGVTAMGCNSSIDRHEDVLLTGKGYINRSFCESGYIIDLIENDTITNTTFKPINLPNKFKDERLRLHHTSTEVKVEFSYKIISDKPETCPGFYGYDKEIEIVNIKKIN